MSRIGRQPVKVPSGVDVKIEGSLITVKGPKGQLQRDLHPSMKVESADGEIRVTRPTDGRLHRSMHGLTRTLVNNMVIGVTQGYSKQLKVVGVGYKVDLKGKTLVMQLGFSHPVEYPSPDGLEFTVDPKINTIIVNGIN